MRSSSPWLLLLPLLGLASSLNCAEGTPADNWVIPGKGGADASAGGGAGQAGAAGAAGQSGGSAGAAGEAGAQAGSGGSSEGGAAGSAGASGGAAGASGGAAGASGGAAGASGAGGSTGGSAGSGGAAGKGGSSGGGTGGTSCTPPVSGGKCDTIPQCGCKAGEACEVAYLGGQTACFTSKNIQRGVACPSEDLGECAPGLTCVGSACKTYCNTDADCASVAGACFDVLYELSDGGTGAIPEMHVCTDQCDLRTNAKCGSGAACVPFDDLAVLNGRSLCVEAGTSTGSCSATVRCAAGMACMGDDKCHRWCRADTDSDCPSGQTCLQLQDPSTSVVGYYYVGNQGFGICGS